MTNLLAWAKHHGKEYAGKLGPTLEVTHGGQDYSAELQLLNGVTPLTDVKFIQLQVQHHEFNCRIVYTVGIDGDQAVLLRRFRLRRDNSQAAPLKTTEWKPIRWFDPGSPPDFSAIRQEAQNDISQAIQELRFFFASPP